MINYPFQYDIMAILSAFVLSILEARCRTGFSYLLKYPISGIYIKK